MYYYKYCDHNISEEVSLLFLCCVQCLSWFLQLKCYCNINQRLTGWSSVLDYVHWHDINISASLPLCVESPSRFSWDGGQVDESLYLYCVSFILTSCVFVHQPVQLVLYYLIFVTAWLWRLRSVFRQSAESRMKCRCSSVETKIFFLVLVTSDSFTFECNLINTISLTLCHVCPAACDRPHRSVSRSECHSVTRICWMYVKQ